jgi:hypothetical protein
MWTVDSLKEWHDFYVLLGTAGATLLALLFVAVSLGAGYLTEERQSGTRMFMSPVVVHFTSVFFLSAVALIPWHQARFFAALIGATALIGAIISTYITIQVVRTDMTNYIEDYLAYGLLPDLGYLALLATAVSIYLENDFGLTALAGALLLLAIVNIRNAWDLTLSMARRHRRVVSRSWWKLVWQHLRRDEVIVSCSKVNALNGWLLGKCLPSVYLAHGDLTGSQQCPEQHGGSLG